MPRSPAADAAKARLAFKLAKQQRRAAPRRASYRDYITSAAWYAKRAEYLASGLSTDCCCCDAPWRHAYHMHHLTYARLGNERLSDITPCCPTCHALIHDTHKLPAYQSLSIKDVTALVRARLHPKPSNMPQK